MTWLDSQSLWQITRNQMVQEDQGELQTLSQLQDERPLEVDEHRRLEELRQEYGRVTLRKARAYALLSLRGGEPLLH